jgi:CheY-like chemotaxis protein
MHAFGDGIPKTSRISEKNEKIEDLKAIQGAHVLLVEDNEINQQVAHEILQGAGLNVTVANDGQEGVDAAVQYQYDAILMDIQMPVMDGYEATRKIRELEGGIRNAEGGMWNRIGEDSDANDQKPAASDQQPVASDQRPVPIIAMTAHAMAGDDKKSIAAGMNDHVTKPIDPDQLFATLQKWIKPVAERAVVPKSLPASGGPSMPDALFEPDFEPDAAVPDEDDLPESLPGFNLTAGLSRLMGNKRLYRKLLLDFGVNYGGVAEEIREVLEAGDFKQAHSLIHNLKGLSGNLEATDLQAAAVEIEKLVKGDQKQPPSKNQFDHRLMQLEKAVHQALEAVQTLGLPAEEKITVPSAEWSAEVPEKQLKEITTRIKAAADMGDVMQVKSIAEEFASKFEAGAPFSDKLVRLADDFDFDGILRCVDELDS